MGHLPGRSEKKLTCLDNFRTFCTSEEAPIIAGRVPALLAA